MLRSRRCIHIFRVAKIYKSLIKLSCLHSMSTIYDVLGWKNHRMHGFFWLRKHSLKSFQITRFGFSYQVATISHVRTISCHEPKHFQGGSCFWLEVLGTCNFFAISCQHYLTHSFAEHIASTPLHYTHVSNKFFIFLKKQVI